MNEIVRSDKYSEIFLQLLHRSERKIITENVATYMLENDNVLQARFLDWGRGSATVTEEAVQAVARWHDSLLAPKALLTLFLDHQAPIAGGALVIAAQNEGHGLVLLPLLLDRLDQRGEQFTITEEMLRGAAGNRNYGLGLLKLLHDRREGEFIITEKIAMAAAGNWQCGEKVFKFLLDQRGEQFTTTEDIIKAAASNQVQGRDILELLLDRRAEQFTITEDVIKTAASNPSRGWDILVLLLDRREEQFTITEDIVQAAVGNEGWGGEKVLKLLIDRRGEQIMVTDEIIKAAEGNKSNSKWMLSLLKERGKIQG